MLVVHAAFVLYELHPAISSSLTSFVFASLRTTSDDAQHMTRKQLGPQAMYSWTLWHNSFKLLNIRTLRRGPRCCAKHDYCQGRPLDITDVVERGASTTNPVRLSLWTVLHSLGHNSGCGKSHKASAIMKGRRQKKMIFRREHVATWSVWNKALCSVNYILIQLFIFTSLMNF